MTNSLKLIDCKFKFNETALEFASGLNFVYYYTHRDAVKTHKHMSVFIKRVFQM